MTIATTGSVSPSLIRLHHGEREVVVSPYAGQVLSYRVAGRPMLWENAARVMQAGKAIRAGIPVCWPWFGSAVTAGQPAHGFARTQVWTVDEQTTTSVNLSLRPTTASLALWPHVFALSLRVALRDDGLHLSLQTQNRGDAAFTFSAALHSYLAVSDIAAVHVSGLESESFLDQLTGLTGRESIPVGFSQEMDRIYRSDCAEVVVHDQGMPVHRVRSVGHRNVVVWTPWQEKATRLDDVAGDDWRHFVCVETAIAPDQAVALAPDETHLLQLHLASGV